MSELLDFLNEYRGRLDLTNADETSITALGHIQGLSMNSKAPSSAEALASLRLKISRGKGALGARLRVELQKRRREIAKTKASDRRPSAKMIALEAEFVRLIALIDPEPPVVGKCSKCEGELRGRAWAGKDGKSTRYEADVYAIGESGELTCSRCSLAALEVGTAFELVVDAEDLAAIPEKPKE